MSAKTRYDIFLSCSRPYTQEQESFISAVEMHLHNQGCETYTVGRSKFSVRQPVRYARDLIAKCDGIVVIAFESLRVDKGWGKPESQGGKWKSLDGRSFTTVWNHMEAAMGYAHDLPILTLVASGLHREGMLSDRLEWYAQIVELEPNYLGTEQFNQVFNEWLHLVDERKRMPHRTKIDLSELKMGDLIKALNDLTAWKFWMLILAVASVIAFVFSIGFEAGTYLKKP